MASSEPISTNRSITMKTQKRVTLRGFAETEKASATHLLTQAGYLAVNTVTACDIVVVGPLGWDAEGNLSQDRAIAVLPFDEMMQVLRPPLNEVGALMGKRPIIEAIDERRFRVLGIDVDLPHLPSTGGQVPGPDRFARICLDRQFLRVARAVAVGIAHGFPTALEGATAASKTSVILWLAHQLAQPVIRLNLHGHTDASELIGRYVPATSQRHASEFVGLERLERFLKPSSRELLQGALSEGRELNCAEASLISAAEGFTSARWRFLEGAIPTAMRHGGWVLLDETNLGEPQVLERLNPALEMPPTLQLSEGDGTTFGAGGDVAVHPGFRIFASMNPRQYAGRQKLSPAFVDRWINWCQAETPSETEYHQQLRFLVYGTHPEVVIDGCAYQGAATEPAAPNLRNLAAIDSTLAALASCHASLASGVGSRHEVTPFTRRSLNALVELWHHRTTAGAGSQTALSSSLRDLYWNRISDAAERKAAKGVAEAAGLPVDR